MFNNIITIGGVGRSGTTILGDIINSMHPVVYLMEPAIVKFFYGLIFIEHTSYNVVFMEDYVYPAIHKKYGTKRKHEAIRWAEEKQAVLVIKSNELQPQIALAKGIKYIEIIRNGLNVIESSLKRGWFTDDYKPIDHLKNGVPYYIKENDRLLWPEWNPATRAACNWRTLLDYLPEKTPILRYENMKNNRQRILPQHVLAELPDNITITDKTFELINSVRPEKQPKITIDDIEQPECDRFVLKMQELGYL